MKQLLAIFLILVGITILLGFPVLILADEPGFGSLPEWQPALKRPITSTYMAGWQAITLKQIVRISSTRPTSSTLIQGNLGAVKSVAFFPTPRFRGFSELALVNTPTALPWRQNVFITMNFHNISGTWEAATCSGTLIDPYHVLTAGHCVYYHETNAAGAIIRQTLVESATVIPAAEGGQAPFGTAQAVAFWAFEPWINNRDYGWDIGLITLDRPMGAIVGWFGYGVNEASSFFINNNFYNPGYPGEAPYRGGVMYYWFGTFDEVTTDILYHQRVAYKGQSGSGVYLPNEDGGGVVYGVLSHRNAQTQRTGAARLTPIKLQEIQGQIAAHTPSQPNLVPLRLKLAPNTIQAGGIVQILTLLLHNYAQVSWEGTALIKTYVSTDSLLTSEDALIDSQLYSGSLAAKGQSEITLRAFTWPVNQVGSFWVGASVTTCQGVTTYQATSSQDMAQVMAATPTIKPTPQSAHKVYLPLLMATLTLSCP